MTIVNPAILRDALNGAMPLTTLRGRCIGKTTAALLRAIANSYSAPGEWVQVCDPDVMDQRTAEWTAHSGKAICRALALNDIEFSIGRPDPERGDQSRPVYAAFVKNTWVVKL